MAKVSLAKSSRQASNMMRDIQKSGGVQSVRTFENYEQALKTVADWQKSEHKAGREGGDLKSLTPEQAERYLEQRAADVSQSTINQERQALQAALVATGKLEKGDRLAMVKSEIPQRLEARAYTEQQVKAILERQSPANQLSTQLAHAAGLRAHELYTLKPVSERAADPRPAREEKFSVREQRENGVRYTVVGKGGLVREVSIPASLASKLESNRLATPKPHIDRGVRYQSAYDISGGQKWSNSFSQASRAVLGRSSGAHGLRHSYAQERMGELQRSGVSRDDAKEVVSQELGHFRPDITDTYLR